MPRSIKLVLALSITLLVAASAAAGALSAALDRIDWSAP